MWALILLFFIIYITAVLQFEKLAASATRRLHLPVQKSRFFHDQVCILQFVGEYLADNPQDFPSCSAHRSRSLLTCFLVLLAAFRALAWYPKLCKGCCL